MRMNCKRLAGVECRGAHHAQFLTRAHTCLTCLPSQQAGSKWRAACLARSQTSSSSIQALSTGTIKARIRSPKEGFAMIRRKKNQTQATTIS